MEPDDINFEKEVFDAELDPFFDDWYEDYDEYDWYGIPDDEEVES